MAKELDAILDRGEACVAESCKLENGSVAFLEQIIHPIYETIVKVSYFFQSLMFLSNVYGHLRSIIYICISLD